MPIFKSIPENEATGKVKEVFDEIKSARQITEVPNFWKMLANDPNELERTWSSLKEIMKKLLGIVVLGLWLYRSLRQA